MMGPQELITKEELEIPIPTNQVVDWVESLLSRYNGTKEEREYLVLRKGLTKEVVEELLPLSKYCKNAYDNSENLLQFYSGSDRSYDADIISINGDLEERIEVTMSLDGQQRRIQAESLNKFGHSPIFHTPKYTGNANNREIEESEVTIIDSTAMIDISSRLLQSTYNKKQSKIEKYSGATLLIGVDLPLFLNSEYSQVIERLELKENTFDSVKCVNIASDHYWCLK